MIWGFFFLKTINNNIGNMAEASSNHLNSMNNTVNNVNPNGNPNAEIIRGQTFEVGPRYTNLTYIGEGAYGMVV